MKLLADTHISPDTVAFLIGLGYDAVRINDVLPADASDSRIIAAARRQRRVILTQDLDFSKLLASSGAEQPSVISLRLSSSRVGAVNSVLAKVLPLIEGDVDKGAIVAVSGGTVRVRPLPIR